MRLSRERRREIDAHAPSWAAELVDSYGHEADRVMLSCLQHPGYGAPERYCFRRVRRELRRCGIPAARPERSIASKLLSVFMAASRLHIAVRR